MSNYRTETNGSLLESSPLFASVWLALFYILRKNYNERKLSNEQHAE